MKEKIKSKRIIATIALILAALFSMVILSAIASSPRLHAQTIKSLDDKQQNVMFITASAATAATALSAVPGDSTTAIADQIMELSGSLLIVVCIIFLEKILLSVFGYVAFGALVPLALIMFSIYIHNHKKQLKIWAIKFLLLALALFMIIPVSVKISDIIEETNEISIEQAVEDAKDLQNQSERNSKTESNWFKRAVDAVADFATTALNTAKNILGQFINTIATLLVCSIAIPVLVVFALWGIIKFIFGISINQHPNKAVIPSSDEQCRLPEEIK